MSPPINIDGSQVSGITIDGTSVSEVTVDGDVVFSAIPDSVVVRDPDDRSSSSSTSYGIRIETDVEWPKIGAELSGNVSGPTRAYIHRVSDGLLMGDTDISGLGAGDTFAINLDNPLQPHDGTDATRYNCVIDAEGSSYTYGADDNPSFPYTSSDGDLTMVSSAFNETGSSGNNDTYNLLKIGNVGF